MDEKNNNSASYIMDYDKNEIVVTIYTHDGQAETRFNEKDIKAMGNWFKLAKYKSQFE